MPNVNHNEVDSKYALELKDLRVEYGDFLAVNHVSLSVSPGEIVGLVGPNGAGKTSIFKAITTLLNPTLGEVLIAGWSLAENPRRALMQLGYMPDLAPVPSDLKVWEFLDLFADSYRIESNKKQNRIEECLRSVSLEHKRNDWCKSLSRGMMQRLVLAKTLLHKPKLYVLDEPASGMDPVSRSSLKQVLQEVTKEGAAVIISSHILSELSEFCDRMELLHQGNIVASGTTDEIVDRMGGEQGEILIRLSGQTAQCAEWLRSHKNVEVTHEEGTRIRIHFNGGEDEHIGLLRELATQWPLLAFEPKRTSFEDIVVTLDQTKPS